MKIANKKNALAIFSQWHTPISSFGLIEICFDYFGPTDYYGILWTVHFTLLGFTAVYYRFNA